MGELTIMGPRVGFGFEGVGFEGMVACSTRHHVLKMLLHRRCTIDSLTGISVVHMAYRHCEPACFTTDACIAKSLTGTIIAVDSLSPRGTCTGRSSTGMMVGHMLHRQCEHDLLHKHCTSET